MLTEKQVKEIREHLERAQNPIFFFDNDQDGLCSFLLLQRYIGRGKGVPIRSFPELAVSYFRRVRELGADYIFILDKPVVSDDFLKEVEQVNLPVVWIDHHNAQTRIPGFVNYYNPLLNDEMTNEPVTALCYQVANKRSDLWIAVIGCISENYLPEFYSDFKKEYPDLIIKSENPLDIYYCSQIGKIIQIFGAGLKDKTTNVIDMLKFLMKAKSPYDVLEESSKNYSMHKRFKEIDSKYRKLLEKAKRFSKGEILFFKYGGDLSISSDLSNGLRQKFPDKVIVVGYDSGVKVNISIRGKKIRGAALKVIDELEVTGGGHEDAVGLSIKTEDWDKFKEKFEKKLKNRKI
ncbi:hypothetical protein CMI44_00335 [Candidatus Pacearchaeota archaeon]|nr:hypothetical protein [Candidatus Pacearchaeota archaeon]